MPNQEALFLEKHDIQYRMFVNNNDDEKLIRFMFQFICNDPYVGALKAKEFVLNCVKQFDDEYTLTPNRFRKLKSVFHNVVRAPYLYYKRDNGAI